ncbi:MAG: hypothetical protein ACRCSF_02475 [Mycobacteriaceae bacterium]
MPTGQIDRDIDAGTAIHQEMLYSKVRLLVITSIILAACASLAIALGPLADTKQFITRSSTSLLTYTQPAAVAAAILSMIPALYALTAVLCRRIITAAAVLAGAGMSSIGLLILDIQLLAQPINANRLELFQPISAGQIEFGWSIYVVLLGHAVAVLAGLGGAIASYHATELDSHLVKGQEDSDGVNHTVAHHVGWPMSTAVVILSVGVAVGEFLAPLTSTDLVVLVYPSVQGPLWLAVAAVVLAFVAVIGAASALTSNNFSVASAILAGVGITLGQLAIIRLVVGLKSGEAIGTGIGSWVVFFCSVGLLLCSISLRPAMVLRSKDRTGIRAISTVKKGVRQGLSKNSVRVSSISGYSPDFVTRAHRVVGILGLSTATCAIAGAVLPVSEHSTESVSDAQYGVRLVILAGILLAAASVWLFFRDFAEAAQPAVAVFLLTLMGVSAQAGQSIAFALVDYRSVLQVGGYVLICSWFTLLATLIAIGVASAAQRDSVGFTSRVVVRKSFMGVLGAATICAVLALCLPLYRGSVQVAPWLGQFPPGVDVWMQLIFAGGIVVSATVALKSSARQARILALAMSAGIAVYLLSWPLTAQRFIDPSPTAAVIPAILAVLLFIGAAFLVQPDPLLSTKSSKKRR